MSSFLALIGPDSARFTPESLMCAVDQPRCRLFKKVRGVSRNVSVANTQGISVIADASLLYRDDLLRRLGKSEGVVAHAATDASLIAAAWLRWGKECVDRFEGDWCFVVHDRRASISVCARDPHGSRMLFWSRLGSTLALASDASLVLALDPKRFQVSRQGLIRTLCLWHGHGRWTVWEGLQEVPAGHLLSVLDTGHPNLSRFWRIRRDPLVEDETEQEAAEQVRALLTDACRQRLSDDARTAVSMSGGWDSTAIYGALRGSMADAGEDPGFLQVISLRYPQGDPGNEDEYVNEVLKYWNDAAIWPDTDEIPVSGQEFEEAAKGPLPRLHHFHGINRAMARAASASGCSVLLGGAAGDLLFDVPLTFLAELFRRMRWLRLSREWRARDLTGWDSFKDLCLRPAIPDRVLDLKAQLMGRSRMVHPLGLGRAPWIPEAIWHDAEILGEEREAAQDRSGFARNCMGPSMTDQARTLALIHPAGHRAYSDLRRDALAENVQFRQPFLDDRLISFSLSRPWSEMVRDGETKILLRRSMEGLLPAGILAPRSSRTGTTGAYFDRSFRSELAHLITRRPVPSPLVDLGIIEPEPLQERIDQVLTTGSGPKSWIYRTLFLERWLGNCY